MKALKYTGFGLLALLLILLVWSLLEPRFFEVRRETAAVPGLPPAWDGQTVALMADFQVGMWMDNEGTIRRIVRRIVEERPAATLIAGDFIFHRYEGSEREIATAVDLVRPLVEAQIPVVAVLGNHDYAVRTRNDAADPQTAAALREALQEAGVQVLHNEATALPAPGRAGQDARDALYVAGVASSWADEARPEAAVAGVPAGAARLVLMHNPNAFEPLPPGTAPLALAGHTHGGQFRLPFTPDWSWMTFAKEDSVHADGWIDGYGARGNRLYVSRGIGMSLVPMRLNCLPELTLFTLRRGG